MWLKKGNKKKSGGKKIGKNHNKEQILNMFKKSANLKCSNMVAFKYGRIKYGRTQIWSHSNMVALKYGCTNVEHRTLKEWLRTHSPRVDNQHFQKYSYGF